MLNRRNFLAAIHGFLALPVFGPLDGLIRRWVPLPSKPEPQPELVYHPTLDDVKAMGWLNYGILAYEERDYRVKIGCESPKHSGIQPEVIQCHIHAFIRRPNGHYIDTVVMYDFSCSMFEEFPSRKAFEDELLVRRNSCMDVIQSEVTRLIDEDLLSQSHPNPFFGIDWWIARSRSE